MQLRYKIVDWKLHLSWDISTNADHYRIVAMSQTFVYYSIGTTFDLSSDLLLDRCGSYIRFKIIAETIDDDKITESNEVSILCSDIEKFGITVLDGYNWTTLGFRSKWVYDLYKIYDKNTLIAETEDPILELWYKITKKKLNDVRVEWYNNVDGNYILWWVSDGVVELPERKKSDYKISVIIPVYNAQIFLPRTIDSILSSSMSDIEIILVDDGSGDNSLKICKWYEKKFPCIMVLKQSNQWVAVSRNNWMSVANGEYIGFVDNDDIVHPCMYEKLYESCISNKSDISIATTLIRKDINHKELCLNMPKIDKNVVVYTYDDMIHHIHDSNNMYFVAVWNKIVKTNVARKVWFPTSYPNNIILYEDSAYTPALYSYIDKFVLCKDAYYIWDKRKQKTIGTASTMHKSKSSDEIWKTFIYAYSYPIYNRCDKHWKLSDYSNFKRLIESYDKFKEASPMKQYWDEKLAELINKQKLYENNLIMWEEHLKDIVNKLRI